MPVTEPASKFETMRFELSAESQYPLQDLQPQLNLAVAKFWRSRDFFWLRLEHPDSQELFDFRIIKIYRSLEATLVALSPARRWNHKRSLTVVTLMTVLHPAVLRTMTEEEVGSFQKSLHFEESFQIISNDHDYAAVFEDQVLRAFGPCANWNGDEDCDSLAFTPQLAIAGMLTMPDQEIEIDLETTISDPGFLKLKLAGQEDMFRILAYFVVNARSYLGVQKTAEFNEGLSKPDLILLELKSKHLARTLADDEFQIAAESFMDACEKEGLQTRKQP